jgi:hypothetical protein
METPNEYSIKAGDLIHHSYFNVTTNEHTVRKETAYTVTKVSTFMHSLYGVMEQYETKEGFTFGEMSCTKAKAKQ